MGGNTPADYLSDRSGCSLDQSGRCQLSRLFEVPVSPPDLREAGVHGPPISLALLLVSGNQQRRREAVLRPWSCHAGLRVRIWLPPAASRLRTSIRSIALITS